MTDQIKAEEKKSPTLLEEVRAERELLDKARIDAKAEADRLERLKSDQMLSGSAGGHIEVKPLIETNREYRKRIEKEIKEGKFNDKG